MTFRYSECADAAEHAAERLREKVYRGHDQTDPQTHKLTYCKSVTVDRVCGLFWLRVAIIRKSWLLSDFPCR